MKHRLRITCYNYNTPHRLPVLLLYFNHHALSGTVATCRPQTYYHHYIPSSLLLQYRYNSSSKSYGPILKYEGPSSRKILHDRLAISRRNDKDPTDDDIDDIWLVRFKHAQLQYPTSSNKNNQQQNHKKRSKRKISDDDGDDNDDDDMNTNDNQNMIFPLNMEIFKNTPNNARKSIRHKKGTGHVVLGLNGSGKSLLINALLHSYNNLSSSSSSSSSSMLDDSIEAKQNIENTTTPTTYNDAIDTSTDIDNDTTYTNPYLIDTSKLQFQLPTTDPNTNNTDNTSAAYTKPFTIAYVSFESHRELLQTGGTTWSVLTAPMGGGQLTKGMQYLIVRFGLYPLLTRDVTTLSTGEIRKVLLIRAIAQQPHLLVLDNAYDGLDTPSRKILQDIVTKTLHGFEKSDILVQGVNVKDVTGMKQNQYRTQVLLFTHRHDEINDAISRITFLHHPSTGFSSSTERRSDRTGKQLLLESANVELLELGLLTPKQFARQEDHLSGLHDDPWFDKTLPTEEEILSVWNSTSITKSKGQNKKKDIASEETIPVGQEIITAKYLTITRNDKNLISDLNWKVKLGERWWLSGLNGAGKSTLSNHLITTVLHQSTSTTKSDVSVTVSSKNDDESFLKLLLQSNDINYISTDRHMSLTNSNRTGRDVVRHLGIQSPPNRHTNSGSANRHKPTSMEIINQVMNWLNLPTKLLSRPFNELSQGEQKMLLIAGIISTRPLLLILDEPIQGLDVVNRHRVLGLLDRICSATNISIIYVNHHYEDLLPSLTHVLHLIEGKATFKGTVETFDCHNTIWNLKLKPSQDKVTDDMEKDYDTKKKRKRRVW